MILKIMSTEDAPDHDTRKAFRLIEGVSDVEFIRQSDKSAYVQFTENGDWQHLPVDGNAYVLNDAGKTIASFGGGAWIGIENELEPLVEMGLAVPANKVAGEAIA